MRTPHSREVIEQLRKAFAASGLTLTELSAKSRIERTKLSKGFGGKRAFKTGKDGRNHYAELDALARALGGRSVFVPAGHIVVPQTRAKKAAA